MNLAQKTSTRQQYRSGTQLTKATASASFTTGQTFPQPQPVPTSRLTANSVVLPMRLFLAVSFLAAGWDKLTDPQFFDSAAGGYIGNQLSSYAFGSPLRGFLNSVAVPNASLFGWLVLVGELAIGLGTLVGLFSRTAAFFGFILSLTLWVTVSWQVSPFFLGSDLPYAMGWLILLLAGAHPVYSLDGQWRKWRIQNISTSTTPTTTQTSAGAADSGSNGSNLTSLIPAQLLARRRFIGVVGATAFAGGVTGLAWAKTLHTKNESDSTSATTASASANPASVATAVPVTTVPASVNPASAATTAPGSSGIVLTKLSAIPTGNAQKFTVPGTNAGAILIHEQDGSVKAFSTVCTHEGCEVEFVASAKMLMCPCHGAQFDITTGNATHGPARRPLASYKVQVDSSGNIVYVQS
jgi:thiosulfate dehydrogenase [quinone] large subunit